MNSQLQLIADGLNDTLRDCGSNVTITLCDDSDSIHSALDTFNTQISQYMRFIRDRYEELMDANTVMFATIQSIFPGEPINDVNDVRSVLSRLSDSLRKSNMIADERLQEIRAQENMLANFMRIVQNRNKTESDNCKFIIPPNANTMEILKTAMDWLISASKVQPTAVPITREPTSVVSRPAEPLNISGLEVYDQFINDGSNTPPLVRRQEKKLNPGSLNSLSQSTVNPTDQKITMSTGMLSPPNLSSPAPPPISSVSPMSGPTMPTALSSSIGTTVYHWVAPPGSNVKGTSVFVPIPVAPPIGNTTIAPTDMIIVRDETTGADANVFIANIRDALEVYVKPQLIVPLPNWDYERTMAANFNKCERELAAASANLINAVTERDVIKQSLDQYMQSQKTLDEELAKVKGLLATREMELTNVAGTIANRDAELTTIKGILAAREKELAAATKKVATKIMVDEKYPITMAIALKQLDPAMSAWSVSNIMSSVTAASMKNSLENGVGAIRNGVVWNL